MNRIINFIVLIFCFSTVGLAQYELDWNNTFGGLYSERGKAAVETYDNGIVVVGHKDLKNDNKYLWACKVDKDGNTVWEKTFKEHYVSGAEAVIETYDHNIIIAGNCIKDGDVFSQSWIIKLDEFGSKIWEKTFGSRGDDGINDIIETYDRGFAAVGYTDRTVEYGLDFLIIRMDENGEKVWEKTFGGSKEDYATSICETSDHGLAMAGYTRSKGLYQRGSNRSFWILKVDELGEEIWNETYGESWWDVATSVTETYDKGLAVVGYTKATGLINYDMLLIKLNENGEKLWHKQFGTANWDEASSVIQTSDYGLAISGFSRSREASFSNFWIIKLDKDGYELWNNIFERSSIDFANDIIETFDKGLAVIGSTLETYSQSGWQAAVLKFLNEDRPEITLIKPSTRQAVTNISKYRLQVKLATFRKIEDVEIIVNDEKQIDLEKLKSAKQIVKNGHVYQISTKIKLKKGKNKLKIIAKNTGGTAFSDDYSISYVSLPRILW